MHELLPFIVAGISTGSVYGLAGTGLVLTYKTSGIFNFAHGAMATLGAYAFYFLHTTVHWNWVPALLVSVLALGPALGLLSEVAARRLAVQTTTNKIVGTIGFVVFVQGLANRLYGDTPRNVPQFFPHGYDKFLVGGVYVSYPQVIVTGVAVVAVGALYALFRLTRLGTSMRAVVDDPDLLGLTGTNAAAVRRASWMIGTTFACLSGVLLLPAIGLQSIALTLLVAQAFGAAAIGAFSSIPLTLVGGLVVGIISDCSRRYILSYSWLAGLPQALPFLVLLAVLLVLPRRRLVPPTSVVRRPTPPYHAPASVRALTALVVVAVLCAVPSFAGTHLGYFTVGLAQAILLLSLGLLVKTSGQVSLCQTTFAAVGAVAFSQLAAQHHIPWLIALLLAALIAVPVGALVAIPAIRLSGLFLALATFGFGIMVQNLFYPLGFMFTTLTDGRTMPRPSFARDDTAYYYLVLALLVVASLAVVAIHESRLGRLLRGLSDAPLAVSTLGLSTNRTRVIVFCISAFLAAVAGIVYGSSAHFASTADDRYTAFSSLALVAILWLAPFREPWFALFMGIATVLPGYIHGSNVPFYLNMWFGMNAVLVACQASRPTVPKRLQTLAERFAGRRTATPPTVALAAGKGDRRLPRRAPGSGLQIRGVTVRFGGLVALGDVSLDAPTGSITGLVGPNGAGKTTLFNACSGLNRPSRGSIVLHGANLSRLAPPRRGRLGLGRTFQRMELGETLSVFDNVALGREAGRAGGHVMAQLGGRPGEAQRIRAATWDALSLCGIEHLAQRQAGSLSTGERRLVELARCLAGEFDFLMLDEPSSGLDGDETRAFGDLLQRVVAERGCGILLVEHDMSLVMRVCRQLYVLDFGQLLFEGSPAEAAASPVVRAAYLGEGVAESSVHGVALLDPEPS